MNLRSSQLFSRLSLSRLSGGLLLAPLVLFCSAAGAQSLGPCNSFYGAGYTLTEGKVNPSMPNLAKPSKGTLLTEPNFKTCLFRATDHTADGMQTFARTDYSRRQSFNANNTYFIAYSENGWWALYDASTLKLLRKLSPKVANANTSSEFHLAADAEPQWHPTDPNALYYLPTNGGTKLLKLDVRTNAYSIAADFEGKLPSWGNTAEHIWTKSEGSPSADARYWGFQVENSNFGLLGYMVWDLQTGTLVGSRQDSDRPDHSSMSAAGRWYVTSSDSSGTWAWSPDFKKKKKLHHKSEHSDLALGPNGEDYYVSVDYQSDQGDVFFTNIDSCPAVDASATTATVCPRTVLFPSYDNGAATAMHFSGKGFGKPGWLIWSTYGSNANRSGVWPWFTNKIYAVELKANPRIYALAYTRRNESAGGYFAEPHATVSRDFTRIAFNSNWGVNDADNIDTYMVNIPASSLPGGVTAPTTPSRTTGGSLPPILGTDASTAGAPVTAGSQPVSNATSNTPADTGTGNDTNTGSGTPLYSRGVGLARRQALAFSRFLALSRHKLSAAAPATVSASRIALLSLPGVSWLREMLQDSPRDPDFY